MQSLPKLAFEQKLFQLFNAYQFYNNFFSAIQGLFLNFLPTCSQKAMGFIISGSRIGV